MTVHGDCGQHPLLPSLPVPRLLISVPGSSQACNAHVRGLGIRPWHWIQNRDDSLGTGHRPTAKHLPSESNLCWHRVLEMWLVQGLEETGAFGEHLLTCCLRITFYSRQRLLGSLQIIPDAWGVRTKPPNGVRTALPDRSNARALQAVVLAAFSPSGA